MNQDFEEPDDWKGLAWDKVIEARNDERRKTIEECAKIAEPRSPRPCDCESGHCYCHNQGDAMAVASWDADMAVANAIRALSSPLTSNKSNTADT
jgi:hypothetical protein